MLQVKSLRFISSLLPLLIFTLLSLLIVSSWYRSELIYGGAEVGLPTYNPQRWLEISKYVWWEAVSPGQLVPHFIVGIPLYFYFYLLQLIGLSAQGIQQVFFFIILFLMGYGMYLVSNYIFDEERKKYAIVAAIFYMFNSYSLVMVWHRFVYTTFILAAVLPFLILFWMKWIKEGKLTNLILFLSISFLSVYMYGNLASAITVWVALILVSLTQMFIPWPGKIMVGKIGLRFLGGFIFWFLTNLWWIIPAYSIAPGLLSQQHSSEDNLGTLVVISRQTIMPYLLQFANPYYLFYQSELGQIYSSLIFKIIPWIASFIIFLGLIISLKLKNYAKYSLIFIVILLLAKGSATPFSYPYIFAFEHFYFIGVLRNPFEKLGIMLPFFGAILFALGFHSFYGWGIKHIGRKVTRLSLFLILIVLLGYAWPMFTGNIFGSKDFPVKVKVPESYIAADQWFKQQDKEGVILHLPFAGKDVVTFDWGYHGVDQNGILFSSHPSLSRVVGVKRVDDTLNSLVHIFSQYPEDKDQILNILQSFNIKYIVLHKDIKWQDKATYGDRGSLLQPDLVENVLNNLDFLKKVNQFGQLVVYKLTDNTYQPIVNTTNNIQIVYPGGSDIMKILNLTKDKGDIITPIDSNGDDVNTLEKSQILIFPEKRIDYLEASESAMIAKINDIFQDPNSDRFIFNQLFQVKAYFTSLGGLQSEELTLKIILSTEKILRLYQQVLINNNLPSQQIEDYKDSIEEVFAQYSTDLNLHRLFNSYVTDALRIHLFIIRQIENKYGRENVPLFTTIENRLIEDMTKVELVPTYKFDNPNIANEIRRQVFKFTIPFTENFELLLDTQSQEADIRINGELVKQIDQINLDKGFYEISYKDLASNSSASKDEMVLKVKGTNELLSEGGRVLSWKREGPTSYSGKISLSKPTFVLFKQTYHPDWKLTLSTNGRSYQIKEHFLGNLYSNAWWVDNNGEYDFKIEFTPQQNVGNGMIVALTAAILLIFLSFYNSVRRLIRK